MKAIALLITSIFIVGMIQLFLLIAPPRTEEESSRDILAISMENCDYLLNLKEKGKVYRKGEKREAIVSKYLDGSPFTGNPAHQYIDPEQGLTSDFPFEEYDAYAADLLDTVQAVIRNKQYTSYNDPNWGYQTMQYYFLISEDGLKQFGDQTYTYGLIFCYYMDDVFQKVTVKLYKTEGESADVYAEFGHFNYEISLY
ncbi:MAG: hypothetical protein CVV04_10535 [Firmicutes bacterium HGW-Firmicutes-9]|jgi:hypothetical protein|nr:MAG: hypothetical protein CVV04_10535 [Firmicutes bacterium HGW-Firmicutes-9]